MINFEFCSPTKFVFGRGSEAKTGVLVKEFGGTKALVPSAFRIRRPCNPETRLSVKAL